MLSDIFHAFCKPAEKMLEQLPTSTVKVNALEKISQRHCDRDHHPCKSIMVGKLLTQP